MDNEHRAALEVLEQRISSLSEAVLSERTLVQRREEEMEMHQKKVRYYENEIVLLRKTQAFLISSA